MNCSCQNPSSQSNAQQAHSLRNIGIVSFVVVELTEYLDAHPHDRDALNYFSYYNRMLNQMSAEFAEQYFPLNLATAGSCSKEWSWGLAPLPWEGGCG